MKPKPINRPAYRLVDLHPPQADLRREVIEGLSRTPKQLPPKLFYDPRGSALFQQITRLPEYYLTRTETGILESNADDMLAQIGTSPAIIEFGSGSSTKVRILLERVRGPSTYVPVDLSIEPLTEAAEMIATNRDISVIAVCADYSRPFTLPPLPHASRRIIFFPGSNLGNLDGNEAREFFRHCRTLLQRGDGMLIGIDRVKDAEILHAAYNDSQGVTAEFNLNLLRRINSELNADFDPAAFEHLAFFNPQESRIEMHLRSTKPQSVHIGGHIFPFRQGETIHTENSYKYAEGDLERLIDGSGFALTRTWADAAKWFSVHYLRVY